MYKLYPKVKRLDYLSNKEPFILPDKFIVFFTESFKNVFKRLSSSLQCEEGIQSKANIIFVDDSSLDNECYRIQIERGIITIFYSNEVSAFYATLTLLQIIKQSTKEIRPLLIEDGPDLLIRGFMLDISRDKVPTVSTIKHIIDIMSNVKMNHLELYVEGFSFGYPSFQQYLEKDGFISPAEFQELEEYALLNYIDLVPNQNGFGHMAKWLEKDEFKDLAEMPEGIFLWGRHRQPSTLNPLDERSFKLVKQLYKDMLPLSNSKYFHMNFDEPFELGKGKSKEACEQAGLGNVYIDYVLKVYDEIKKYNKTPLIWGDVLIKHPELLDRLPDDMIFVDWGYDANYPFSKNLKKLSELGIKFMAAPGTTSWCSFSGRTYDWYENIYNACLYTKRYNGLGMLLTDWGDFGHLQFLPVSYPPLIYSALMSWRVAEGTFLELRDYLNEFIYYDELNIFADALLDLGNYYRYLNEYRSNGTATFYNFMWAVHAVQEDKPCTYYFNKTSSLILNYEKYSMLERFLSLKEKEILESQLYCDDGEHIKRELIQTIHLLRNIHKLNIAYNESVDANVRIKLLKEALYSRDSFIAEQRRLWLLRNKKGGLESSISYIERFYRFLEITLNHIRGEDNET